MCREAFTAEELNDLVTAFERVSTMLGYTGRDDARRVRLAHLMFAITEDGPFDAAEIEAKAALQMERPN